MINQVAFQGRLVEDAKCGQTTGGTDYANFRLAWSKKYKEKETKCFLDCKAFSGTAKFVEQYLGKKGQEMIVEGELNTEEWEKEGVRRSKITLAVDKVHFCGKRQDGASAGTADAGFQPNMTPVDPQDELPF